MSVSSDELRHGPRPKLRNVIVVLIVLVVFGSALLPGLQRVREAARRSTCIGQFKLIGLPMHDYNSFYGHFPPAYLTNRSGRPTLSWRAMLLPYEEEPGLYNQCRFDEPWDSPHNRALATGLPIGMSGVYPFYHCASDVASDGLDTSYVWIVGKGTVSDGPNWVRIQDVTDGTAHTIYLAEMAESGIPWMAPRDLKFDAMSFKVNDFPNQCMRSRHPGIVIVGTLDGSVHCLHEDIDPKVLKAMCTIAGREPIPELD
jgi:hypothetical protein